jgi:hypothetical protein
MLDGFVVVDIASFSSCLVARSVSFHPPRLLVEEEKEGKDGVRESGKALISAVSQSSHPTFGRCRLRKVYEESRQKQEKHEGANHSSSDTVESGRLRIASVLRYSQPSYG